MKKIAINMLCLAVMLAPVFSTVEAEPCKPALNQDDRGCPEGDKECLAEVYLAALIEGTKFVRDVSAGASGLIGQLSRISGTNLRLDQSFQMNFRNAFPNLATGIENNVQSKYGFKLPYIRPKAVSGVEIVGIIAGAVYLGQMWDEYVNENIIEWMVNDLTSRGWSQEDAQKEANFVWYSNVAPLTQLFVPIVGHIGNIMTGLEILGSGKYYSAYELLHRDAFAYFRSRRPDQPYTPNRDTGRSYMAWAALREGSLGNTTGVQAGCSIAVWVPGHHEYIPGDAGITVIWVEGQYQCLVR